MEENKMAGGGYLAGMRESMCIQGFVGKAVRRKPVGRTMHRLEDNIETDT
jgi:hypothetical protein